MHESGRLHNAHSHSRQRDEDGLVPLRAAAPSQKDDQESDESHHVAHCGHHLVSLVSGDKVATEDCAECVANDHWDDSGSRG